MYTLNYIKQGTETQILNLDVLSHKYNIIISSFIVSKIIIEAKLDLCSDLIYSKPELLHENEFKDLLKLFDDIIRSNSANTFIIKELTNTQLKSLIKKFELSNQSNEEFKEFYNRLLLAIYLFLNYKHEENIKLGELIEETLYKGDEYYIEAYDYTMPPYRLYNTIIIPEIGLSCIPEKRKEYIEKLIKIIVSNGGRFTQDQTKEITNEIKEFDKDTQAFILYLINK
jgi:hypothetical protein